ncbi:Putative glucose-methanol-choline oxidoreductase, glucose Oxidase, domain 2 [Septoria linicola]|uniref:Glucose-methanol-choline oxidoreductase, glucose Oxidase, domain 2 n=1 Tax=Septoria linicola TaxID=215465 RepID=A0A9Q9AET9_9PEZI|nr:putative glucose-methanol-choline oxidoreductase, glucose Oxidase, domain 2 [Septoria linicola]USW47795.1 Putative glucose-methanol-choline oxidoreductase, glucose Oxidase, domain 2 [Septoria linicola]
MPSTRLLIYSLGAAAVTYAQQHTEYDYIICGGGTAGLVVANRLSEANHTVLVVEAGVDGTTANWGYTTTPQTYAGGRVFDLPAGKTVGGTSQVNGKVYSRPDADSIDDWGRVNNADWSWNTLLPFYKASETLDQPSEDLAKAGYTYNPDYHGTSGPLNVSFPAQGTPEYFEVLKKAAATFDIAVTRDFNGGKAEGLATYPATFTINGEREQIRESSREAYYLPAVGRSNLELLDETICLRVVFGDASDGNNATLTATGVEIANSNNRTTISARKEVILSAGVYRSPGILEYSGIGNSKLLANHSIETKVDLPGVGENLQDQMQGNIFFERANDTNITFPDPVAGEITTNYLIHATYEQIFGDDAGDFQERTNTSLSEYATTISERINGTLSSEQILNSLQVQYGAVFNTLVPAVEIFSGQALNSTHLNLEFWPLIPLSRGSVHISGGNPERAGDSPIVDVNWGILDHDWEIFIASARFVRNFFKTDALAPEVTNETQPGLGNVPEDASDAEWRDYWQDNFRAGWHGVGSAAMLPREWGGVVDGDLTVYGTANVRVVDASVIPFQLGGHPTATVYALAERAASLIVGGLTG